MQCFCSAVSKFIHKIRFLSAAGLNTKKIYVIMIVVSLQFLNSIDS